MTRSCTGIGAADTILGTSALLRRPDHVNVGVRQPPRDGVTDTHLVDAAPSTSATLEDHPLVVFAELASRPRLFRTPRPAAVIADSQHHERIAPLATRQAQAVLKVEFERRIEQAVVLV